MLLTPLASHIGRVWFCECLCPSRMLSSGNTTVGSERPQAGTSEARPEGSDFCVQPMVSIVVPFLGYLLGS